MHADRGRNSVFLRKVSNRRKHLLGIVVEGDDRRRSQEFDVLEEDSVRLLKNEKTENKG